VPLVDVKTGLMNREWYRFFNEGGTFAGPVKFKQQITTSSDVGVMVGGPEANSANPAARKAVQLASGGYDQPGAYGVDSNGDKFLLYVSTNASYDGRQGIGNSANMWWKSSTPASGNLGTFEWWNSTNTGGIQRAMLLDGAGALHLLNFTAFRYSMGASLVLGGTGETQLDFNTLVTGDHDNLSEVVNGVFTAKFAGFYFFRASLYLTGGVDGQEQYARFDKNAAAYELFADQRQGSAGDLNLSGSIHVFLNAGDTISVIMGSTAPVTVVGGTSWVASYFSGQRVVGY
ncbi:MAG: C1q-like domain-containing protein, partial [Sulfobacillus sp.]